MADRNTEIQAMADEAIKSKTKLKDLVGQLSTSSRINRQSAASALKLVAKSKPEILVPHIEEFLDALSRPEAQTRWESLESLTLLIPLESRTVGKAFDEAENALFDEESGPVRLAGMRYFCKYGATTVSRSEKAWPLIDEGIQCYHGDIEFNDMLIAIVDFSGGKLHDRVKGELRDRMSFDATNGKGLLQKRAQQILDNLS